MWRSNNVAAEDEFRRALQALCVEAGKGGEADDKAAASKSKRFERFGRPKSEDPLIGMVFSYAESSSSDQKPRRRTGIDDEHLPHSIYNRSRSDGAAALELRLRHGRRSSVECGGIGSKNSQKVLQRPRHRDDERNLSHSMHAIRSNNLYEPVTNPRRTFHQGESSAFKFKQPKPDADADAELVKLSAELEGWKRMANQGNVRLEGMQTKVDSLEREREEINVQRSMEKISKDMKKIERLKIKLNTSESEREEDMQEMERWKRKAKLDSGPSLTTFSLASLGNEPSPSRYLEDKDGNEEMSRQLERIRAYTSSNKVSQEKGKMEGMQVKLDSSERERGLMRVQPSDMQEMEALWRKSEERCKMLEDENRKLKELLRKYDRNGYHRSGSRNDRNDEDAPLNDTSSREGGNIPSRHSSKSLDYLFSDAVLDAASSSMNNSELSKSLSTLIRSRRCSNQERPSTPNNPPQATAAPSSWHGGGKKNIIMVPTKGCSQNNSPISNTTTPTSSHSKKSMLEVPTGIDPPFESRDGVATNCAFTERSSVSTLRTLDEIKALSLDEMEALLGSIMARENDGIDSSSRSVNDVDRSSKSGPF